MRVKIIIAAIFLFLNAHGQKECPKYDSAMKLGNKYYNAAEYDKAITEFQAAQIAARECGMEITKASAELTRSYKALNEELIGALQSKKEADLARRNADRATVKAEKAQTDLENKNKDLKKAKDAVDAAYKNIQASKIALEDANQRLDSQQRRNKKIISSFYFFHDKYGLAFREKFGFINREGDSLWNGYQYDKAEMFSGGSALAHVTKNNNEMLLDTLGREYRLFNSQNSINRGINRTLFWKTIYSKEDIEAIEFTGRVKRKRSKVLKPPSLELLFLYDCKWKDLSSDLKQIRKLRFLSIRRTRSLSSISDEIGRISQLEGLDLSSNSIKTISGKISNLSRLKMLNASNNRLNNLPFGLWNVRSLVDINLSRNQLRDISSNIQQLKSLEVLDLSYNELKSLPTEIYLLLNLKKLNLVGNQFDENQITIIKGLLPGCDVKVN